MPGELCETHDLARLPPIARFGIGMPQAREQGKDFTAGCFREGQERISAGKKAFRWRPIGKHDLMRVEHEMVVCHLLTALHHTRCTTLHPGKVSCPN